MRISIELNSNTKKHKRFKVVVKPDNQQVGKIVFYTDDVFLEDLWKQAKSKCGGLVQKNLEVKQNLPDPLLLDDIYLKQLDEQLDNLLNDYSI